MSMKDTKLPARPTPLSPPAIGGRSSVGPGRPPSAPPSLPDLGAGDLVRRAAALLERETAAWKRPGAILPPPSVPPLGLLSTSPFALAGPAATAPAQIMASSPPVTLLGSSAALTTALPPSAPFPGEITVGTPGLPGARCEWALELENPSPRPLEVNVFATDFLSETGGLIPRYEVAFAPAGLVIPPRSRGTVNMTLTLPLQTLPGSYAALVRARGLPAFRSIVVCDVA